MRKPQPKRPVYIAIDLKSYYASVECVERGLNPLTTNLLVADETRSDKTICLAVSPSLKAMGVPSRPRLFEAKQAIKLYEAQHHTKVEYIIAKPQMALYEKVSAKIYSIYLQYISTCDIHVYSIDEVFIEATHYMTMYASASEAAGMETPHYLAMAMIRDVLQNTGITATAGIGTNLYLAKVAMDIVAKKAPPEKDGVRIAELNELSYKMLLWCHTPLTAFWQVGPGKARRLARHNIFTMGDIAQMSLVDEEWFYKQFGIDAELLIDHAWGKEPCTLADIKSYRPKANSRSVGQVLPRPYKFGEARIVFSEMIDQLAMDLVSRETRTKELSFWVGFDERVHKKEINYVSKHELDADEEWELNHRLYKLHCLTANSRLARANMVSVSIEYFAVCTDEENDAYLVKGQYKIITGMVLKVDPHEQTITVRSGADTEVIPFSDIYRIFKPTG